MRVRIKDLQPFSKDERGEMLEFQCQRAGTFLMGTRKANSVSGNHFHKGISSSKDPEVLFLLSGSAELSTHDLRSDEQMHQQVTGPAMIEIDSWVWHTIIAVTDISFVEFNSLEEHKADTFYEKEPYKAQ